MLLFLKRLIYISLGCLVLALYKADYLTIPQIASMSSVVVSFACLWAGFVFGAISWQRVLVESSFDVDWKDCLAGYGLFIFSKYVPGKIFTITGPAAYLAEKYEYSLTGLSAATLNTQLIVLWLGLIFGMGGVSLVSGFHLLGWAVPILWIALSAVLFTGVAHKMVEGLISFVFRKPIQIPSLAVRSAIVVMPPFVASWLLWSVGFYMLIVGVTAVAGPWYVGLGFPLAVTLGIAVLIAPGGLGAREGAMVGFLTLADIPLATATMITLACRLWFFAGEVFMFILGWLVDRQPKPSI